MNYKIKSKKDHSNFTVNEVKYCQDNFGNNI